MGNAYYYFCASLSMIDFDGKLPVSSEDFLNNCERLLEKEDYTLMKQLFHDDQDVQAPSPSLKAIIDFNRNFRNTLAWIRAERAGKDPSDYIRGERYSDPLLVEVVQQAVKEPNLLTAEKSIDRAQWQLLDDLAMGHYFDIEYLCVYGLKLKILERYNEINSPKGAEIFEEYKEGIEIPAV